MERRLPVKEIYNDYSTAKVPYYLNEPDTTFKLPWDLEEISGLSYANENTLVAIQDEKGLVFHISTVSGEVLRKQKFAKSGDYEGIEVIKGEYWVMKSNGDFFHFKESSSEEVNSSKVEFNFKSKNDLEGLGQHNDKLLVACKAEGSTAGVEVNGKGIYKIIRNSTKLFLSFSLKDLNKYLSNKQYFNSIKEFDPSAIATHPLSKDIYVLSADHALVIFDKQLKIKEIVKLKRKLFEQPEGIAFGEDGTMYISSEGNGSKGKLFVFSQL